MTPRQHRVREIDFRRPTKFSREVTRRLEHSHDTFCQSASSRLSAELRTELQLGVLGTDQLPYSVLMADEVPKQSFITILKMEQLGTEIALVIDMPLAHALVGRLLGAGANSSSGAVSSHLTSVEVAVARRAVNRLVDSLSTTWMDIADVTLQPVATSLSPLSVQIVPPSEPTLLLNFSAQIDSVVSIMTLIMPYRSVSALMPKFEQSAYGGTNDDGSTSTKMHDAMGRVNVELRAEVAAVELPLADVLRMRPGDVIALERPVTRGVTLFVDEVPAYSGNPGRNGNLRAVQVREPWSDQ
ncbi:MAG: flagellar motor switch protein FliM [Thermoleophilaceae bacterium]